jgi:hypothetical protein
MTAEKKKAQQDKNLLSMKTMRQTEGIDTVAKCKKTNREYMKRCHKADSIDIVESCKKIDRENKKRHCMAESHDAAATQKTTTIHQKRENNKVGSVMLAQFAMTRK